MEACETFLMSYWRLLACRGQNFVEKASICTLFTRLLG